MELNHDFCLFFRRGDGGRFSMRSGTSSSSSNRPSKGGGGGGGGGVMYDMTTKPPFRTGLQSKPEKKVCQLWNV